MTTQSSTRLSLTSAIAINLTIMLGIGVFINTVNLARMNGSCGFMGYLVVAALLAPLIITMAQLIARIPEGGFYAYGRTDLSPLCGFVSAWTYWCAKLASASLMIHVSVTTLQYLFPALQIVSPLVLDTTILGLFSVAFSKNIKTSAHVLYSFLALKLIPLLCVLLGGIVMYTRTYTLWSWGDFSYEGLLSTLPLVLYVFTGFEASCSLSTHIQNPARNGPRAIIYSFLTILLLVTLYQLLFTIIIPAPLLGAQESYRDAFKLLLQVLGAQGPLLYYSSVILLSAIALSALGGAYGILFSNQWNLYALALKNHLPYSHKFTPLNIHGIPLLCTAAQIVGCALFLWYTAGTQIVLQQIGALGSAIAYTISVIGSLQNSSKNSRIIPGLALASCTLLLGSCVRNFLVNGPGILYIFALVIIIGTLIAYYRQKYSTIAY